MSHKKLQNKKIIIGITGIFSFLIIASLLLSNIKNIDSDIAATIFQRTKPTNIENTTNPVKIEFDQYEFSQSLLEYVELVYGVDIIEIPIWASKLIGYAVINENQAMLGLSLIEDRKMVLFTEGLCDYIRWQALFHELYHVLFQDIDEDAANTYAKGQLQKIDKQKTNDCEPF